MYTVSDADGHCQSFADVGVSCSVSISLMKVYTVSDVDGHCQLSADVGVQCQRFRGTSIGVGGRADTCKKLPDGFEFSYILLFFYLSLPYTNTCTSGSIIYCSLNPSTGLACT